MSAEHSPSVSLHTPANELGVTLAGRVAAGAAEALALGFGPERRLVAISIEAARNVVDHAYVHREPGAVEMSIELIHERSNGETGEPASGDVLVRVRDTGGGCPLTATSTDPPGLGLAMISELSESMTLHSTKDQGTEIDATVHFGANGHSEDMDLPRPDGSAEDPAGASELEFGDPSFLMPILPRVMAAHALGGDAAIDAIAAIVERGRELAQQLEHDDDPPPISISVEPGGRHVAVRVGPLPMSTAEAFLEEIEGGSSGQERVRIEGGPGERARVLIEIPLQ